MKAKYMQTFVIAALALSFGEAAALAAPPASKAGRPAWSDVKKTVSDFFAAQPGFDPASLITQEQAKAALDAVEKLGWKPKDGDEILKKIPSASDPLVRTLSTPSGKKLLRQTSSYSLVYDRLDRTIQLPGGPALLETITKLPDGAKYLQTKPTPGFKNLAQLLPKRANGQSPAGVDYDKPTGRIYTLAQLLTALEASYKK